MPDTVHPPPPPATARRSRWAPTGPRMWGSLAWGLAVGVIAGLGMRHPGDVDGRLIVVAAIGAGPALVATVPLFYVLGSMAWNLAGGEAPPPDVTLWPVTLTYGAIFAMAAFLNALFWSGAVGAGRSRTRLRARRGG